MKKLKYILFILPFLFISNVFADTSYDMTSRITSPVNFSECGNGSYTGVELNGATNCWNTNTRYQGTLNRIYFNLPAPTGTTFESDISYRLTLKMATDDWRNNFGTVVVNPGSSYTNNFVDTFTFISMKQINITFTVPYSGSTTYQSLWVNLPAKSSSHLITGVSNWNLSNVTLTKLTTGSGGGSTTPGGPSSSFDDTAIINSGNENTQEIIDNNNTNTQDIINNANSNTDEIVKSNQICNYNLVNLSNYELGTIAASTGLDSSSNNRVRSTDFIPIEPGKSYNFLVNSPFIYLRIYFYDKQKNFITSDNYGASGTNTFNISNATYVKLVFSKSDNSNFTLEDFKKSNAFLGSPDYCLNSSYINSFLDKVNNQNIINNQNESTDKIKDSIDNNLNTCNGEEINIHPTFLGVRLLTNGTYGLISTNSGAVLDVSSMQGRYIDIIFDDLPPISSRANYCFASSPANSNNLQNCLSYEVSTDSVTSKTYSNVLVPAGARYLYLIGIISNTITDWVNSVTITSPQSCKNKIDNINDTLNNDNIENGVGSGFFDNFTSEDFGLSQIITIPLNTIQSLTSKSCSPLSVPIPFTNSNVSLPCMTEIYQSKFPGIYNLWKIVSFGIVAYLIAIDIFHIVKGFKDPESDKVEVLDL